MQDSIVIIVFLFLLLQFINVLLNLIFKQRLGKERSTVNTKVSILIPARNEAHNIGKLLHDLSAYNSNDLEIIVCNDHSTDNTVYVVESYANIDNRIKLIHSPDLPTGWLGKNHACNYLSKHANGAYLLFLDADVRIDSKVIFDAISYMQKHSLKLLSTFPQQYLVSLGEKFSVPIMNYILLTMLPLFLVRKSSFTAHSAANGQFMLFERSAYLVHEPHKIHRDSMVEDIAISRYYKRSGLKMACIIGEKRVTCRMYSSYKETLEGFSKNIFDFFGGSRVLAFLFWLFVAFGFVPVLLYKPSLLPLYLFSELLILVMYALSCGQKVFQTILYFPNHIFFMLHVMIKSCIDRRRKNLIWKGRKIQENGIL